MKYVQVLVLAAAALLAAQPARATIDRERFVALGASVWRIEVPRASGGYALGSGVSVAPGKVITNCHVTRDAREIHIVRGEFRWRARAQASDLARDLCLLDVPDIEAEPVPLGRASNLKIGQTVTALGFTGGLGIQSSVGEVVELHRHDGSRVIQSNNWFSSGASGGGLFDDAGQLVGVLTFRLRGGEVHYFAAPVDWVQQMLDTPARVPAQRVMPLPGEPQPYWARSADAQPRFLKASQLQRDDRWTDLASFAGDWARDDRSDAEPWFLLGWALAQLGRLPEARQALECSLALEADRREAWSRLAGIYQRTGQDEQAARIQSALAADNWAVPPLPATGPSDPCAIASH